MDKKIFTINLYGYLDEDKSKICKEYQDWNKSLIEKFPELGFEYKKYNEDFAYEYIENGKTNFVHFITERQTYCTNVYHVSLQLHNAITAQMKELERI